MEYVVKPMSRKDIRNIAKVVRRMQSAKGMLYFDIMDFLEHTLPRAFPEFTLSIGTKEEMGEFHGLTFPEKNEIKLREDVYYGAHNGNGRDRLTAAHELFHFLAHSKESVAFARTGSGKVPTYMDPEWQANAFGGELLVPYEQAKQLSIEEIAEKCGVSKCAATCQYRMMHRL
ncbi:ImmA/IrrE family metallo-endopeptidase [Blautia sp. MSJ-36]|uniref:ImmA/IrrE family metallo-endopeptidase n=1 Tax=Blautia sp. MSJ-36 TaxID=2841530 RepID=UPI001C10636F|nr:ImmA/IrrE family metallo-endopeptidase [Blautia sp. MSJ-36]MBU5448943.1 ImmA/IrrE family metallo-endopeptidase [Blautia sp. MSJ-36]